MPTPLGVWPWQRPGPKLGSRWWGVSSGCCRLSTRRPFPKCQSLLDPRPRETKRGGLWMGFNFHHPTGWAVTGLQQADSTRQPLLSQVRPDNPPVTWAWPRYWPPELKPTPLETQPPLVLLEVAPRHKHGCFESIYHACVTKLSPCGNVDGFAYGILPEPLGAGGG